MSTLPEIFPAEGMMIAGTFFETELDFMLDFQREMRDSGLKRYATSYAELIARRPKVQPSISPSITTRRQSSTVSNPKPVILATEPQKRYIRSLLSSKDTTKLASNMDKGWTLDSDKIDSLSKSSAKTLIEALLLCPAKTLTAHSDKIETPGSPKQVAFINKLFDELNFDNDIREEAKRRYPSAKELIGVLMPLSAHQRKTAERTKAPKPETITPGMYKHEDRIFKVYLNREKTRLLVKELINGSLEYLGMAQYKLPQGATRMTLDEAKAYGKTTGTCCVCGITLENPESIAAGIGPICSNRV